MTTVTIDRSPPWAVVRTRVDVGALAVVATVVVGCLLEVGFAIANPEQLPWYRVVSLGYAAVASLVILVVARAVMRHDPRHPVGWLLGMISVSAALAVVTNGWTVWELPGSLALTWVDWCVPGIGFLARGRGADADPDGSSGLAPLALAAHGMRSARRRRRRGGGALAVALPALSERHVLRAEPAGIGSTRRRRPSRLTHSGSHSS